MKAEALASFQIPTVPELRDLGDAIRRVNRHPLVREDVTLRIALRVVLSKGFSNEESQKMKTVFIPSFDLKIGFPARRYLAG